MSARPSLSLAALSPHAAPAGLSRQPQTADAGAAPLWQLRGIDRGSRASAEAFIAARYAEAYGARVTQFLPRLISLDSARGDTVAICGMRSAADGPLFLEHYLDAPIELCIERETGRSVRRSDIVEIGNLAGAHPGALRLLIPLMTRQLDDQGCRWVVFTGGQRLINGFHRLGAHPRTLAQADLARLPAEQRGDWGSYYAHSPSVVFGDVAAARHYMACGDAVQRVGATADAIDTAVA